MPKNSPFSLCLVLALTLVATAAPARPGAVQAQAPANAVSIQPARILDTRPGEPTIDNKFSGTGQLTGGNTLELTVAGRANIPTDADAVFLNLTATNPTAPGFLTIYPCGTTRPTVSNVNYQAGQTIPNSALAKIGDNGNICIFTRSTTHIIADVNGYVPNNATPNTIQPARILDTRPGEPTIDNKFSGTGQLTGGNTLELTVAGRANIPTDADAVFLNLTATNPTAPGFLTIYPCGTTRPTVSNVNYQAGQTIPNSALAKIGDNGNICIFTRSTTHIIADVNGYVPNNATPNTIQPARILDTRPGEPTIDNKFSGTGQLTGGNTLELTVAGRANIPTDADAVFLNLTATNPTAPGFLTIYPCGTTRPTVSNVNYQAGQTIPNSALAKIGDNGNICIFTRSTTHIIADVNGYVPNNATPVSLDGLIYARPATNGTDQAIFLADDGQVTQVELGITNALFPSVSRNGRFITFVSSDVDRPSQTSLDVYRFDRATNQRSRLIDFTTEDHQNGSFTTVTPTLSAASPNDQLVAINKVVLSTITDQNNPANNTSSRRPDLIIHTVGDQAEPPTVEFGQFYGGIDFFHSQFRGITWSPDGTMFATPSYIPTAFSTSANGIVTYTFDQIQGWHRSGQITQPSTFANPNGPGLINIEHIYPAFSPDGQQIAYFEVLWPDALLQNPAQTRLIVANANGSNPQPVVTFTSGFIPLGVTWTADGDDLVWSIAQQDFNQGMYSADPSPANAVVRTVSAAGGPVTQIPGVDAGYLPTLPAALQ